MNEQTVVVSDHTVVSRDTPSHLVDLGTSGRTDGVDLDFTVRHSSPEKPTCTFGVTINTILVQECLDLGKLIPNFIGGIVFPSATPRRRSKLVEEDVETQIL